MLFHFCSVIQRANFSSKKYRKIFLSINGNDFMNTVLQSCGPSPAMPEVMPVKALLTDSEAEKYLSLPPGKLRQGRYMGHLYEGVQCPPHIKMGKRVYYRTEELDQWINEFQSYRTNAEFNVNSGVK